MTIEPSENKAFAADSSSFRLAGLAAMLAGLLYLLVQVIHPADTLTAVTTASWQWTHILSLMMDLLAMIGLTAIHARQARRDGVLNLVGYVLFLLFFALSLAFHFMEAFVYPILAADFPALVQGLQGLVTNQASTVSLGALPSAYALAGGAYLLGGVFLGVSIIRARVFPPCAGGLLALGTLASLLSAAIPHPYDRILAAPVGLALMWLGWALYTAERNGKGEQPRVMAQSSEGNS